MTRSSLLPLRIRFGTRYYDPAVGRWTQLDPSGVDYHYAYVRNNPVNSVDPSGRVPCAVTAPLNAFVGGAKIGAGIAAAVAGTVAIPFTAGLSGPPAYAYAAYQGGSGSARIARAVRQADDSGDCGFVDLAKRLLPDPSSITDFVGGLL